MQGLHLNIGCGKMPLADHVNIDEYDYEGVDVVTSFPPLPYDDNTVDSIYCGHCLEHFYPDLVMEFLADCYRVLKPTGSLTLVVPDADKARLMALSGILPIKHFGLALMGETYDSMPHHTIWNKARLERITTRAGFRLDANYDWKQDSRVYDRRVLYQCGIKVFKP